MGHQGLVFRLLLQALAKLNQQKKLSRGLGLVLRASQINGGNFGHLLENDVQRAALYIIHNLFPSESPNYPRVRTRPPVTLLKVIGSAEIKWAGS